MKFINQLLVILWILISLISCTDESSAIPTLTIIDQYPENGTSDVLVNVVPSLRFDKAINQTTLTASSVTLIGGSQVSGEITYDTSTYTVSFIPDQVLQPGTQYTLTLTTEITDLDGNHLTASANISFATESYIRLISLNSFGEAANGGNLLPSVSADGRYVVFYSSADNLVENDTNNLPDIFLHDTLSLNTTRVSVSSSGVQGSGPVIDRPGVSDNGLYVVFSSAANNLVDSDTNISRDIFIHNTETSVTKRISVNSAGTEADNGGESPSISADGNFVVYISRSSNLVSNDTAYRRDTFLYNILTATTTRVNIDSNGAQANGDSYNAPSISDNGRYIAFASGASNLIANDTNNSIDIFVHDTQLKSTTRVNINSSGSEANNNSLMPNISSDGRYIAFVSDASNLVENDTNNSSDIFVHDLQTSMTIRVSVDSNGMQANDWSYGAPSLSGDGQYVVFSSFASNLVPDDSNDQPDIFIHNIQSGTTKRLNVKSSGEEELSGAGFDFQISSDGRYVVFDSIGNNLVDGDSNYYGDVFRVLASGP